MWYPVMSGCAYVPVSLALTATGSLLSRRPEGPAPILLFLSVCLPLIPLPYLHTTPTFSFTLNQLLQALTKAGYRIPMFLQPCNLSPEKLPLFSKRRRRVAGWQNGIRHGIPPHATGRKDETPNAQVQKGIADGNGKRAQIGIYWPGVAQRQTRSGGQRAASFPACACLLGGKGARSDGDSLQAEYLGLVPEQPSAELNDPAGDRVEVLHLVGLEFLEELPQALDEAALLLTHVLVGIAKLQEDLVIWMKEGQESALRGGVVL